jgi:hypothetical protein
MGEEKLPTYFVLNASRLVSATEIKHYNLHEKTRSRFTLLVAERVGCDRHHCRRILSEQFDRRNADSAF